MKNRNLSVALCAIFLLAASRHAEAAIILQTQNYSNVNGSASGSGTYLFWDKFDTGLGTLTGVTMQFTGNLSGSFDVLNLDVATPIDVYNSTSTFRLNFDGGLGAPSDITGTAVSPIGTTPGTGASPGTTIAAGGFQNFTIDSPVSLYSSGPVDYFANASYFSSVGAANFYTILFREFQVTVDGSAFYSAGYGGAVMSGAINLTYDYTPTPPPAPVPEPGTWAAAALLTSGAAFMRWRKRAKVA